MIKADQGYSAHENETPPSSRSLSFEKQMEELELFKKTEMECVEGWMEN